MTMLHKLTGTDPIAAHYLRPSWDAYFLAGAAWVATRADCTRSAVGAILVNAQQEVRGTGYNGAPSGVPGCASASACPRGRHYRVGTICGSCDAGLPMACSPDGHLCACGGEWPCELASPPDSDYSNCIADHAERNAIRHTRPEERAGGTLYTTRNPCPSCWTLIRASRLARVVSPAGRWTLKY
jgi:dCMP deaminase